MVTIPWHDYHRHALDGQERSYVQQQISEAHTGSDKQGPFEAPHPITTLN